MTRVRGAIAGALCLIAASTAFIAFRTNAGPWRDHDHGELPRDSRYAESVFSADGGHMAYVRHITPNMHVVLDGEQGPPFSLIQQVKFLSSGRLVYGASEKNKDLVIDDGKRTGEFDHLDGLTFTGDGREYVAVGKTADRWSISGSRGTLATGLSSKPEDVALSADGRRCAYGLVESDRTFVVGPGGQRFGPFDYAGSLTVLAARDAVRYVALKDGRWGIYEDNTTVVRSDYQLRPIAGADEELLGHIEDRIETSRVVFRTSRHDAYADVLHPTVSEDGQHLLYVAKPQKSPLSHTLIRDGKPTGVEAESMSEPVFDARGTPSVVASIGPSLVVFNGNRVRGIENARIASGLAISPQRRYLGVGVVEGRSVKWKAFDTEEAAEWQDPHAGKTWTYVHVNRANANGWEIQRPSGDLRYQGKVIEGVAVKGDRPVLIAARPANVPMAIAFAPISSSTTAFLVNLASSSATMLGDFDDSFVAWSPSGSHVLVQRGPPTHRPVAFATANAAPFDPMSMFSDTIGFVRMATATLQWRGPHSLQVQVDAACDVLTSRLNPECRGIEVPNRAFVLTVDLDKQFAEAQRLDVPSPPGAREAMEAYWSKVVKGDIAGALDTLSSAAKGHIGSEALVMLRSLAPLFQGMADRRTFKPRTLKIDGRSASSTIEVSGPDFSQTPAGKAFGMDMFGWQLSAAFTPEKELIDRFIAIVRKHAPALRAADAPITSHTSRCDMTFEGDRWAMSEDCANLMPRR
jgi:hypothetical protein